MVVFSCLRTLDEICKYLKILQSFARSRRDTATIQLD